MTALSALSWIVCAVAALYLWICIFTNEKAPR